MTSAPVRLAGALAAMALCASGCLDGVYRCTANGQCMDPEGAAGSCVAGYCAYSDTSCPSGQRYGEFAGDLSGQCTDDGSTPDARPDGAAGPDGAADAAVPDTLSPPDGCIPADELCNGGDDNCNGIIDDGFILGQPCDGPDGDVCEDGITVCTLDQLATECNDGPEDSPERCNGRDDNCDGATDEGFVLDMPCDGLDGDDCVEGVTVCDALGTGTRCNDETTTTSELCNGADDDCDGAPDDGFALGVPCDGTGDLDFCAEGVTVCNVAGDGTVCNDMTGTNLEVCNGNDDNCNGATDEGFALGVPCDGTADGDLCAEGVTVCNTAGDGTVCNDMTSTNVELCNGMDDNCNTLTDEGFNVGASCDGNDSDACLEGMLVCNAGGSGTSCTDVTGSTVETCNGVDDDCRNGIDDPWPLKGTSCTVGTGACARTGTFVCTTDGTGLTCNATEGSPGPEYCGDGVDSDCLGDADPICPTNDLRGGAVVVSGAGGTFSADTRFARDNVAPTCQTTTGGRDVFYQFTLAAAQVVYVDTFGSSYDTVLRLEAGACTAGAAQSQCVNDSCAQSRSQLVASLGVGTWCLAVDSNGINAGTLALNITLGGRTGTVLATGTNLTRSGQTCNADGTNPDPDVTDPNTCAFSPDAAPDDGYYFALCPATTRTFSANTCNPTTVYDSVLYLRAGSATLGSNLACNDDDVTGGTANCMSNPLASRIGGVSVTGPGLFWLMIDGYDVDCGLYQITYSL